MTAIPSLSAQGRYLDQVGRAAIHRRDHACQAAMLTHGSIMSHGANSAWGRLYHRRHRAGGAGSAAVPHLCAVGGDVERVKSGNELIMYPRPDITN